MSAVFQPVRARFTTDQVLAMVDAGVFAEDPRRIELIDGELIEMPPIGVPHSQVVNRLTRMLVFAYGERATVSVQNGVAMRPDSLPQPDLAVLAIETEARGHPYPVGRDAWLLVEVADTSLRWDCERKMPLYARSGVAQSWVVDLNAEQVLVFTRPASDGYAQCRNALRGEAIALPGPANGAVIEVDRLFG